MDKKHWLFEIVNEGGRPKIKVMYKGEAKTFFPEEISSFLSDIITNGIIIVIIIIISYDGILIIIIITIFIIYY